MKSGVRIIRAIYKPKILEDSYIITDQMLIDSWNERRRKNSMLWMKEYFKNIIES